MTHIANTSRLYSDNVYIGTLTRNGLILFTEQMRNDHQVNFVNK